MFSLMLSNQIRREGGKRTRTGLSILYFSLDSDSPFWRDPPVDLRRAADLDTSSTEITKTTRRSLTSISTKPQIMKGATLTKSCKINNISRNFESKSTNHRSTRCNPCRGKNKIFQTKLAKKHKRSCDLKYSSGGFFGFDNISNSKENSKFAKFKFGAKANSSKRNFGSKAE